MTAIMRAEHQEPEVARFIDSYKYDQQTAERRQKYGGGTSLPLDSDGYEDRQRRLKEELRNDFLVQQEKPSDPVYFRVGTPEQGLRGLGQHEQLRQEMNIKRQREYNDFLREKKNLELQKIEARRNRPPPPVTQPPAGQVDYDQQNLRARTEDRRAYQDHMKAQEERYWRMRGKPVTPPGGLDIGHYDKHVKEQAPQKKKEYKETLDQQQKEQMFIRARQEPEMPVLDRSPPQQATYLASKPPPGPQQGHPQRDEDEERRRHEEVRRHRGAPAGFQKDHHYSSDEYEKFQRNLQRQEGEEYREFLKKKNQEVRNRDWNFGNSGVLDLRGDDENQSKKQLLREERQKEYNEYMNQQRIRDPPRRNDYFDPRNGPYDGIFSGLGDHGNTKEVLGQQRKQEYNEYLDQYPQTKAGGRPTWVKETLPNNTDRGRSPMRNPQPADHYQQMLDEKRREEAQRRRFDDPEYQGRLPPNSREARYTEDMQQQKYGYYQQE